MALGDGLLGYWKLDEASGTTAFDGTTNGNDGTWIDSPTPTTDVPSVLSNSVRSLDFTQTSYVNIGTPAILRPTTNITISCWIKITLFNQYKGVVVYGKDDTSDAGYAIGVEFNGKASFKINTTSGSSYSIVKTSVLSLDTWYNIIATYDGVTQAIYLDAGLEDSLSLTGTIDFTAIGASEFDIGTFRDSDEDRRFPGKVDDVGIWGRVITSGERTSIAAGAVLNDPPSGSYNSVVQRS